MKQWRRKLKSYNNILPGFSRFFFLTRLLRSIYLINGHGIHSLQCELLWIQISATRQKRMFTSLLNKNKVMCFHSYLNVLPFCGLKKATLHRISSVWQFLSSPNYFLRNCKINYVSFFIVRIYCRFLKCKRGWVCFSFCILIFCKSFVWNA